MGIMSKGCGFNMPDGNPYAPNLIMQNGKQAREAENIRMNEDSYWMYMWRLMDLAMSVFEWKNLPEGVDARMLEYWTLINGFCVFFKDDDLKYGDNAHNAPQGYAVLQAMLSGEWDMYNYPKDRRAYSVNGLNIPLTEENSVIIYNDYLRVPMFPALNLYAKRLAEIDRTIDVNVKAQKTVRIIPCEQTQQLTFKNLQMDIEGNQYVALVNKGLDLKSMQSYNEPAPYVSNDLQVLKHQYWNEALTFLGVENVTTEKKERLVSDEVMSNMGDVEAQRFTRLNSRKRACEEINRLFGLNVEVEFRSGIYIKADGYGAQNIASTGMKDTTVLNEGAGYENTGFVAKLAKLLGGA